MGPVRRSLVQIAGMGAVGPIGSQRSLINPSHTALVSLLRAALSLPQCHRRPWRCSFSTSRPRQNSSATTTTDTTTDDKTNVTSLRKNLQNFLATANRGISTDKRLSLKLGNQYAGFDHVVLRDACTCSLCVDPSTKQKRFQTQDIPNDIRPKRIVTNPDDSVKIIWSGLLMGKNHVSEYSAQDLRMLSSLRISQRARYDDLNYTLWDKAVMEKDVQFIPYKDYMENDETLLFTLQQLATYGLVFLKDVPKDEESVARIANRVGYIQETCYGRTWDVKSVPNAKNIAYTPLDLGLHMDLLYYASPPTLQFLHCLENTVTGGSSYFVDSFRAVELIRLNSVNFFKSLTTFPVNFHYKNDSQHYHYIRPTVVLQENTYHKRKRIDHVNYSPPFQAPFDVPNDVDKACQWRQFYHALSLFGQITEDKSHQFELTMKEGECVILHNRRVLHARKEFDPESGNRWLKGTYVDGDAFRSKLRVLTHKFKKSQDTMETDLEYSYIQ